MSEMIVTFWGTRGSIPTPDKANEKFGGNTTCLEIRHEDSIIVIDAGTGIRKMSLAWEQEFSSQPISAYLLFTHLHWDHIQGFPFFSAAYREGNTCTIYGGNDPVASPEYFLGEQMHGAFFPVPLSAMRAELRFETATPQFELEGLKIRTLPLPHPGGCLGYRIEVDDQVFVLATDSEFDQIALNRKELVDTPDAPREYETELLDFLRGADLLIIDCQYSDEEYRTKVGWGHNQVSTVVDLCRQVSPDMVALTHHDPMSADEVVVKRVEQSRALLNSPKPSDTLVFGAREGVKMRVKRTK